jgi:xanthine dehydrogenase accessory factor
MDDLIGAVGAIEESGEKAALASLIWSSGSIPMSDRAKMLVREDGRVIGTIGGGCLEAEILTCGRQVIESGNPHLTRYTMTEEQAGESGLNCGGTVRIYTEVIQAQKDMLPYQEVGQARERRQACIMATLLGQEPSSNGKMLIYSDGRRRGSLGAKELDNQVVQQLEAVFEKERGVVLELEGDSKVEAFVEPFLPAPLLYIFGGGHVGGQICTLAKNVGFEVVIVDDRPMFANAERHPIADGFIVEEMDRAFEKMKIDEQSYIIAATRGHQHDEVVIEQAIRTDAAYVGMLGSERKKMILWKRIVDRGGQRQRLDQVFAPVGLNIGADTPEEIAVSVVAELIQARRGVRKKWKTKMMELAA